MSEGFSSAPPLDVPSLTLRWEGLVVAIDANTLNTILRKATRNVHEIDEIRVEPEDGKLGILVRIRKGIRVTLRGHVTSLRLKDGFLGFTLADAEAFGFLRIPSCLIRKVVDKQPPGRVFFYPAGRIFVVNLNSVLPAELTLQVREVVFEGGEIRLIFGPSQYRLDRLIDQIGQDPFVLD